MMRLSIRWDTLWGLGRGRRGYLGGLDLVAAVDHAPTAQIWQRWLWRAWHPAAAIGEQPFAEGYTDTREAAELAAEAALEGLR